MAQAAILDREEAATGSLVSTATISSVIATESDDTGITATLEAGILAPDPSRPFQATLAIGSPCDASASRNALKALNHSCIGTKLSRSMLRRSLSAA